MQRRSSEKDVQSTVAETLDQIASWGHLKPSERQAIMQELEDAGYPKPDA